MKNLRYNGNINSMQWQNGASAAKSGYKFSYDGLNRLTSAIYGEGDDMSQNADRFSEKGITYNANGSIYRMKRYGMLNDGSYGLVDDLKIKLDGNALYGITDYAAETNYKGSANFADADGSGQEYWFNGNGSLSADANKGIARIDYDNCGCPRKIVFTNGNTTEYVYSSTGEKLRTTHKTAIDGITVALNSNDNLKDDDFLSEDKTDYHGSFIYENGKLDKVLYQGGYVEMLGGSLPMFHYYNQDHLGNNRSVVRENGYVQQITNYYPFGGVFSTNEAAYAKSPDAQPYKYNGKELDRTHGLDWYDYGARNYDATLPMWDRVDPLCEEFYHITPYAYCYNNPVNVVDPDGRIGHIVVAIGIGAGIGAGVEILSQVTSNAIKNGGLSAECFTEINWPDVGYAAAAGAISGSASALGGKIATSVATRTGSNITGKVFGKVAEEGTEFVADVVGNIGDEEVLKSAAKDYAKGKFVGKFVDKKLAQPYINSSAAVKAAKSRAANAGKKLTQKEINKVVRENKAAQKSATKNKSIERSNKAKEIAVDYLWNTAKKLFNF